MTKRKRLLGLVLAAVLTISAVAAGTAGVVSAETVGIVGEDIEIATQTDTSIAVVTEPGSEEPEETPAAEEPFAAPGGAALAGKDGLLGRCCGSRELWRVGL